MDLLGRIGVAGVGGGRRGTGEKPPVWPPQPGVALSRMEGYAAFKAALDVVLSLVFLVVAAPVILVCVVAVKLTSRGPAFYSQLRLGKNGRPYRIYKIRTMAHDCERTPARSGLPPATRGSPRSVASCARHTLTNCRSW